MNLPLADEAEVPRAKIVLYLLNPEHRAGKGKARFFASHGFAVEDWQKLADALRQHAREHEITKEETSRSAFASWSKATWPCLTAQLPEFAPYGLLNAASEYRAL